MTRVAALLALLLLATCAPKPVPPPPIAAAPPAPVAPISLCQVAANGGPVLGDRGIGGTGLSADEERLVERGIGGTGIGTQIPPSVVRGLTENRGAGRRPKDERTGDAGIVAVDIRSKRLHRITHDPNVPTSLPDNTVLDMLRDRAGLTWVATNRSVSFCDARQTVIATIFPSFTPTLRTPSNPVCGSMTRPFSIT